MSEVHVELKRQVDSVPNAEVRIFDGDRLVSVVSIGIVHGRTDRSEEGSCYPIITLEVNGQ